VRTAAIILGLGVCFVLALLVGQKFLAADEQPFPVVTRVHFFKEPSISLNNIELKVFYVAAAGRAPLAGWREALDESFRKIAHFHSVQFLGRSLLEYEIAPEPMLLPAAPTGTRTLFDEDRSRLDLIEAASPHPPAAPGHYRILVFIAEGNGLDGRAGAALAPAAVFRDPAFSAIKESVVYRAIGRALGLPSGNEGVMGIGAFRPIETTFIEPELVQKLGLLD
jgi:hypothetical protein